MSALRQKRPFLPFENAAACPEWFARTVLENLDRHSADRVSVDARILRDLKLNYSLILQAEPVVCDRTRTKMRAPVTGGVTNLLVRQGDHTVKGQTAMSIIDADGLGGADAGTHAAP
jgi:biotin carboxyl carrier protein